MAGKRRTEATRDDDRPLGYSQCEWVADGERCRYPGSISRSVNGHGPWYCSAHDRCSNGAEGAQVVEASMSYRHLSTEERDARYVREVLKNVNYRSRTRGCEARECVNPSIARKDGHYLCHLHRTVPAEELGFRSRQPVPPKAEAFLPVMREPGEK